MVPNVELKPCPFCGCEEVVMVEPAPNTFPKYYVLCMNGDCSAEGPVDLGWSGAAEMWNTRVGDVEFDPQPNLLNNDESLGIHPTARCIRCGGAMEILDMRCANECEGE
jgi:Lar family restriction alleviation protein